MATTAQRAQAQAAWAHLLASADVTARGTVIAASVATGASRNTVGPMRARLLELRAKGRGVTGSWARDSRDGPRAPRKATGPRALSPAELARRAEAAAREEEWLRGRALEAQRRREEAQAELARRRALPPEQQRRKVIVVTPRPAGGCAG